MCLLIYLRYSVIFSEKSTNIDERSLDCSIWFEQAGIVIRITIWQKMNHHQKETSGFWKLTTATYPGAMMCGTSVRGKLISKPRIIQQIIGCIWKMRFFLTSLKPNKYRMNKIMNQYQKEISRFKRLTTTTYPVATKCGTS